MSSLTHFHLTQTQEIDLSQVLLAIHNFFTTLGPEGVSQRSAKEDRPLRMVKTVLFEVRSCMGMLDFPASFDFCSNHIGASHQ